jgi:hypothetical protein
LKLNKCYALKVVDTSFYKSPQLCIEGVHSMEIRST